MSYSFMMSSYRGTGKMYSLKCFVWFLASTEFPYALLNFIYIILRGVLYLRHHQNHQTITVHSWTKASPISRLSTRFSAITNYLLNLFINRHKPYSRWYWDISVLIMKLIIKLHGMQTFAEIKWNKNPRELNNVLDLMNNNFGQNKIISQIITGSKLQRGAYLPQSNWNQTETAAGCPNLQKT